MFFYQPVLARLDSFLFGSGSSERDSLTRLLTVSCLGLLFFTGIAHWVIFFSAGNMSFVKLDWGDGFFYYAAARDMVVLQAIPYFTDAVAPAWGDNRFLANPQSFMSPQILLFPLMSVGQAVLVNTLIFYVLGFIGLMLIRNHFHLSMVPFTLLFLLFNFNGHLTAHLSVGHSTWNGYFLLPFFFLIIFKMLRDDGAGWLRPAILLALVMLGMIMQGSFHIFTWCLMFLFVLGLVHRRYAIPMLAAMLFGVSMSLFRLIPTALVRLDYTASYASGYPTVNTLIDALTTIKAHLYEHPRNAIYNVGWHEHDIFIGFIGLAFILYFGFFHRFSGNPKVAEHRFPALDLPIIIFILLSFGFVFDVISDLRVPLLSWAERVPSRFLVFPLVILTVISAVRMEALLPAIRDNTAFKVLCVMGVGLLAHSLFAHSWFWRLASADPNEPGQALKVTFDWPENYDAFYVAVVNISWGLSFLAFAVVVSLFLWSWRGRKQ